MRRIVVNVFLERPPTLTEETKAQEDKTRICKYFQDNKEDDDPFYELYSCNKVTFGDNKFKAKSFNFTTSNSAEKASKNNSENPSS